MEKQIKCFIDPIFLAINEDFDKNTYLNEIFMEFSNFLIQIEKEEKTRGKFIKFNLNGYFLI